MPPFVLIAKMSEIPDESPDRNNKTTLAAKAGYFTPINPTHTHRLHAHRPPTFSLPCLHMISRRKARQTRLMYKKIESLSLRRVRFGHSALAKTGSVCLSLSCRIELIGNTHTAAIGETRSRTHTRRVLFFLIQLQSDSHA